MWLIATLCLLGATGGTTEPVDDELGICKRGMAQLAGNGHVALLAESGVVDDTDVLHYVLDIEIFTATDSLGGSNTITVRSLIDGLTTFRVRLRDNFNITDVQAGGSAAAWQRLNTSTIEVDLDRAYDTDEQFDILVVYDGQPVSLGFGSINFTTRGGHPLVFTLSEPWYAYTWWPAKDDNSDKATGQFKITVPDTLTVASNGTLLSVDDVGGGRLRYDWLTGYQTATYLFSFSAAFYTTFSDTYVYEGGSMPVDFFIFPDADSTPNRQAWLKVVDMLPVMSGVFGLYPFIDEKYGIYHFAFGGGMEHQTMTGQGTFSESVTAHELGHSWFGNMITCRTWQDIWLNEGFATYSEALWYEFEPGSSGAAALHAHMASRRPSSVNGSVYVPAEDAGNFNRIFSGSYSYRKGGWVLHQLRHVVGDQTFFDILAAYRVAFQYDSAITEDFRQVAEGVYGNDLTWFFDEWVYDIGAPAYRYAWREIEVGGADYVELFVQQVQDITYPIFTMPLDVELTNLTSQLTQVIWNDAAAEHFLLASPGSLTGVELDPDDWTLHTSNSQVGFVEGPPKLVVTAPEPGGNVNSAPGMTIEITFHKDIVADAADFTLVGDTTGPATFAYGYDGLDRLVTLTPDAPLPGDDYTLTISDGIVDVAAGLSLDGELSDSADPQALPSGDGLPGGDGVVRFTANLLGDINGDGIVDITDFLLMLAAWGPCPQPCPPSCSGDLDGSCAVDVNDFLILLANWS
jgi:hypothetical protein